MGGCLAQLRYVGGRGLVFYQLAMPDFIDSSWEILPFLRSGLWGFHGEKVQEGGGGEGVGTVVGMQNEKALLNKG